MKSFKEVSILYKLIIINSILIFLVLLVLSFIIYLYEKRQFFAELERNGRFIADTLAHNLSLALLSRNSELALRNMDGFFTVDDLSYVAVYFDDGHLFAKQVREGAEKYWREDFLSLSVRNKKSFFKYEGVMLKTYVPVYSEVMEGDREEIGLTEDILFSENGKGQETGYVLVGLSRLSLNAKIIDVAITFTVWVLAVYLAGILLYVLVIRRFIKPVSVLSEGARRVSEGDLDVRLSVNVGGELGVMASAFNQMVDSLKSTINEVNVRADEIENLLEGAREGIFILNEQLIIIRANKEISTLLGFGKEEIVNKHITDFIHQRLWIVFEKIMPLEEAQMREISLMNTNGDYMPFEINFMPIVSNNRNEILAFARDISERKMMEAHLVNTERLVAAGRLAADIAHEVNNPLGIIKNYLELSRREIGDCNNEVLENINIIDGEINRIARIIRGLLTFSRPGVEATVLCDVNGVILQTVQLVRRSLENQRIEIEEDLDHSISQVIISPDHLKQVLINLINNAKDAMPSGGLIRVQTSGDVKGVRILVDDNGSGISEDAIGDVFTPFHTTKGVKGTGLGLSVSYGIVKGCGGEITLENKNEGGIMARVFLPYGRENKADE